MQDFRHTCAAACRSRAQAVHCSFRCRSLLASDRGVRGHGGAPFRLQAGSCIAPHRKESLMRRVLLTAFIAAACAASAQAAPPASSGSSAAQAAPFTPAITAQGFGDYDKAISSDFMEGRKPGTEGAQRATSWIVE